MDKLDQQIRETEQRCVDLRHQLELAETQLQALKLAADLRPSRPSSGNGVDLAVVSAAASTSLPPRRRKRPWALSAPYRRLLQEIIAKGNPLLDSTDLADLGRTVGIDLKPKEMGSRFNRYSKVGMAERSGYHYRLTEAAVRAFGDPSNEPPENSRWRNLKGQQVVPMKGSA